jgi:tetratricopeptide (TPR) repeat protein
MVSICTDCAYLGSVSSPRGFHCPFCGEAAKRNKEHVWAQWMRKQPAAQQLLEESSGRRLERPHAEIRIGTSGQYEFAEGRMQRVAELLPHVQVDVCIACNGGWMKDLEDQVKTLLAPWSRVGWPVRLRPEDQTLLATWATKSWMAYALLSGDLKNPFRTSEYRAIANSPQPLDRARVWLIHSDAPGAYVGMGLDSTLLGGPEDLATKPDNSGFGFLAYAEWVFFLILAPQDGETLDAMELGMPSVATAIRIWPPSNEIVFPTATASASDLSELLAFPAEFHRAVGLPVIGLTPEQTDEVHGAFLAGANPLQIRARWSPEDLGILERHRLAQDPEGYGRTPEPYKVLGGIAWHGGNFDQAVDHYQQAMAFGASVQYIGSQLCDALMHVGRYQEAAALARQVMDEGPNEWRDLFRAELLNEIVVRLQVLRQTRALGRTSMEEALAMPLDDLRARLRDDDALDPMVWHGIVASASANEASVGGLYAAAFLADSPVSWIVLIAHATSAHGSQLERDSIRDGLIDLDGLLDEIEDVLDELRASTDGLGPAAAEVSRIRDFVDATKSVKVV